MNSLGSILTDRSRPKTGRWNPEARHSLAQDFEAGVNTMAPLLDNWLLTCPNRMSTLSAVPPVTLTDVLQRSGKRNLHN